VALLVRPRQPSPSKASTPESDAESSEESG
jgi:hypothetical protein